LAPLANRTMAAGKAGARFSKPWFKLCFKRCFKLAVAALAFLGFAHLTHLTHLTRDSRYTVDELRSHTAPGGATGMARENAELRRRLGDALEELARVKTGGAATPTPIAGVPAAQAICTGAVVEKAASIKIAQLRSQLGEERGAPCAKKEIEEMDVKTARWKALVAQVTASKCYGAVVAERDFWQYRVFRLMTSAVLSEVRHESHTAVTHNCHTQLCVTAVECEAPSSTPGHRHRNARSRRRCRVR